MGTTLKDLSELPSPFYRVAVKAIIFDEQQRLLVVFSNAGNPELPGGGWEHTESFAECLRREIQEELGVQLTSFSDILFTYRGTGKHGWQVLRLVVSAEIESTDFKTGADMAEARFVTKDELLRLEYLDSADAAIKDCANMIWSNE